MSFDWVLYGGAVEKKRSKGMKIVIHTRKDGTKIWYREHRLHREDGPACEDANGDKYWYLNGKGLTEKLFNKLTGPVKELPMYLGMGFDGYISERLKR